jgi:hypothetical protein
MKRSFKVFVAVVALTLTLALPASAGARTEWQCTPPGEPEQTFVSAADAAFHGIDRANQRAGMRAFLRLFGEKCEVVLVP